MLEVEELKYGESEVTLSNNQSDSREMNVGIGDLYRISVNAMFGDDTVKVLGTGGSEKYLC